MICLMEIFKYLPVRSLIRFKSVCKNWRSLISDDHFCHQHTLRHPKLQQSLILQIDTSLELFYFNPTVDGEKKLRPYSLTDPDLRILHACNGLLLLESKRSECSRYTFFDPRHQKKSFYVYNPATKRSRKISLPKSYNYPYVAEINLAFDPLKSPHYKIVCLRSAADTEGFKPYNFQIEAYDSESHAWKLRLERINYCRMSYGVYWNDAIYWSSNGGYCNFDITKNEMKLFPFPKILHSENHILGVPELHESNGHLYHFVLMEEKECISVALWEFGGNNPPCWLLKYYHPLTLDLPDTVKLVGSEADGACSLLTCRSGKIGAYNFLDKSYKDLVDLTSQPFHEAGVRGHNKVTGFQFGETLALV